MLVQFFALSVPYLWHFLQCLRSFMNVYRKLSEIIYMNFYARSIVPMHVLHVIFCIFEYFNARFRMFMHCCCVLSSVGVTLGSGPYFFFFFFLGQDGLKATVRSL